MSESIESKIRLYRNRYYRRELIRGVLITVLIFIFCFLTLNSLESIYWFGKSTRLAFLIILLLAVFVPLTFLVIKPLLSYLNFLPGLSNEHVSREVGKLFPEIKDQLTNYLELKKDKSQHQELIHASLAQKEQSFLPIDFSSAIDFSKNKKILRLSLIAVLTLGISLVFFSSHIGRSTERITAFQKEFVKPSPFQFIFDDTDFTAYKNEDYQLSFRISGSYLPEEVYLELTNDRKVKLLKDNETNQYTYTFANLQNNTSFRLQAAGYYSASKEITLLNRPELLGLQISLDYPGYVGIADQTQENTGHITIPEGTNITWNLKTRNTDSCLFVFANDLDERGKRVENDVFQFQKQLFDKNTYKITLANQFGKNKSPIEYSIEVIKDQKPEITAQFIPDTSLYSSVLIISQIADDYGFSKLLLNQKDMPSGKITTQKISINPSLLKQSITHLWKPETSAPGESFEIWLTVYDNDGVNGSKKTESQHFYFNPISDEEKGSLVAKSFGKTENDIKKAENQSNKLTDKLDDLKNRMQSKSEVGWQEEKLAKEILDEKQKLEKSIEDLKAQFEQLQKAQEQFSNESESLKQKSDELNKLLSELLDDETKKLYDELQKLLQEKQNSDPLSNKLSEINRKEKNLQKELDRALELFKRLQRDSKMESVADKLEELSQKQEAVAKESSDQTDEEQFAKQQEINEEFEKVAKEMEEIAELNEELKDGNDLEDELQKHEEVSQDLEDLSQEMQSGKPKPGTKKKQEQASSKMKEMANQMRKMQQSMEMEMLAENIENLEGILDNLIKSSMEQERIIHDFRGVSQTDPRFITLSQDQLQLVDNTKIIQDSLVSLAKRVPKMSNIITREIDQINHSLDQAFVAIKERNVGKATSHQQFGMTSMNNLALLLDNLLQNMQMSLSEASGNSSKPKEGSKPSMSSMGELQKQLSKQIQELQKSGKSGRGLSEELARLAAEQARIREEMESLKNKLDGQNPGGDKGGTTKMLKEAIEKMEENETDLVNKRLSQNLIKRQKDITTRMLEIEKATKEQDMEEQREAERAQDYMRDYPPAFEEYLKTRKSQIELLNTIPLDLNPFYKKEVNEYFRRLSAQEK